MTSTSSADEVAALQDHLSEDLTALIETLTATGNPEKARRLQSATHLREHLSRVGPTTYTVCQTALYTGVPTTTYLSMTASHWEWQKAPQGHLAASQTLAACHIFDSFTLQKIGESSEVVEVLRKLELPAYLATEGGINNRYVRAMPAFSSVKKLVKVARIVGMEALRETEAIRQGMRLQNSEDPVRDIGRAETIATCLRYAHDHEPARIVTEAPSVSKSYRNLGLATTTLWELFAEAAKANRLSTDEVRMLREFRQKHDQDFELRTSTWPKVGPPPNFPKPPGITLS